MELIIAYFSGFWGTMELIATALSIACVYLASKHNQWTWFFGILGVLFFGAIFYEFTLYSDMLLQLVFFLPMQIWGYFTWKKMAESSGKASVTRSTSLHMLFSLAFLIVGLTVCLGYYMDNYTDASYPYPDAWTTWMSVVAQILMIKKFWQSWVFWFVMDIGAIYIYAAKGLYVTSGLYVVFLVLAGIGWYRWYFDYNKHAFTVAS